MKKIILISLVLTGCATANINEWKWQTESKLYESWGAPNAVVTTAHNKIVDYQHHNCIVRLTISKAGMITKTRMIPNELACGILSPSYFPAP